MDVINQQVGSVGQGYDDNARGNQLVRDESRQYLERLMGNYGMGGDVVANIQNPMETLTNQLIERNTRYGQDARTALSNWGAQHNVLYGDAQTNARGAQAFQNSAFQSQLGNLLAEAQAAQREREIEFASALQGLAAQRGGFEVEYATDLAQRDSDRNLQMAEMQMRAALEQAKLDADASRFNAEQSYRGNDEAWEREKFAQMFGLDVRKQDFAEWMAMNEAGNEGTEYSGISGMRTYAQDAGNPGIFDQANSYIQRAAARPGIDPAQIGQVAESMVRQPVPQYGRIGAPAGRPGQWERPRNYEDIINAIAIGTGRY